MMYFMVPCYNYFRLYDLNQKNDSVSGCRNCVNAIDIVSIINKDYIII